MTKEQIYAATDKTYANCLVCHVNPVSWCVACGDRLCPSHHKRILGEGHCPICYAIQLVNQRERILNVMRQIQENLQTVEDYEKTISGAIDTWTEYKKPR